MSNLLGAIIDKCKCGWSIEVNEHRNVYETVEQYISDDDQKEIEPEVFQGMVKSDTVIRIQFYPETPIGFFVVYHYDMSKALQEVYKTLTGEEPTEDAPNVESMLRKFDMLTGEELVVKL